MNDVWKEWEEYNHGLQGTMTGSSMNQQGLHDAQTLNPPPKNKKKASSSAKSKRKSGGGGGAIVGVIVLIVILAALAG